MHTSGRTALLVGMLTLAGCAQQPPAAPPDTRAADQAAIEAAVKEWNAAAQAKDAEKFAAFYAEDAVLMMEGAPDVSGRSALREAMGSMMQDPNFALSFAADEVVVARAGDLAYETGAYSMTMSGPEKNPVTQKGHYLVVWRKDADGAWKVLKDVPVSDPPEAAAQP